MAGRYGLDAVLNSEVIDLSDTNVTCQPWPDHPVGTWGAVGGLINDQLIICGGYVPHYHGATSACHIMTPLSTYNHFNLTIESQYSAGVVLDHEALLISGGIGNEKKNNLSHLFMTFVVHVIIFSVDFSLEPLDRIEYIYENGHRLDYLPMELFGHCLIRIPNEETLVLTGGYTELA